MKIYTVITYIKNEERTVLEAFPYFDKKESQDFFELLCKKSMTEINKDYIIQMDNELFKYEDLLETRIFKITKYIA